MTGDRCIACGKPIVLINVSKARGRLGLQMGWVHRSRWVRHAPIAREMLR